MPHRTGPVVVISLMLGMSLFATLSRSDIWPISSYGMFARPPHPEDPYLRLWAVSETGERFDPFYPENLLHPADRFLVLRSLTRTVLREKNGPRAIEALTWLKALYERANARAPLRKIRRLVIEVEKPFSPDRSPPTEAFSVEVGQ
jgi:hypothetical protein